MQNGKYLRGVKTTCCYCGVGCGIEATIDNAGRVSVAGEMDHPVNKGMLCSKGMNLHYTVNDHVTGSFIRKCVMQKITAQKS